MYYSLMKVTFNFLIFFFKSTNRKKKKKKKTVKPKYMEIAENERQLESNTFPKITKNTNIKLQNLLIRKFNLIWQC